MIRNKMEKRKRVSTKTDKISPSFSLHSSTCQSNFPSKFQKLLTEAYVVAFLSTLLLPILRKLTDDNIEGLSKTN